MSMRRDVTMSRGGVSGAAGGMSSPAGWDVVESLTEVQKLTRKLVQAMPLS